MLPETDGISYKAAPQGPYAAGDTVEVTATLDEAGVGWPDQLPEGWTETSDTEATFTVEFDAVACTPVIPATPEVTQATCTGGVVSEHAITLRTTTGVIYSVDPDGPYDGTQDVTVTVTATVADRFAWGQLPEEWIQDGPSRATFTVELTGTSCEDVTPVEPTVTDAVCTGGVVTMPTLTLAETDGITYAADPEDPYTQGQSVLVTATLDAEDVGWPDQLPEGWTETSDTQATFTVEFDAVECMPVSPVAPTVTQATCTAGVVTVPTIVLGTTTGIIYEVAPPGPYDGTKNAIVTVTAILADGYEWGQIPERWQKLGPARATYTVVLAGASCEQVTPVAPTVTQAECAGGVVTRPTLALAETDGITYAADPEDPYTQGQSVLVTATLDAEDVGWPDQLPEGWTETSDTQATFTVEFDAVACKPVTPVAPTVTQATCVNGAVTSPAIVLGRPRRASLYSRRSGRGVRRHEGCDRDGHGHLGRRLRVGAATGEMGAGSTPARAKLVVVLTAASCEEVTPVEPTVTDAVCTGGVVTRPTLTLAETDGITYAADPEGPYTQGAVGAGDSDPRCRGCRLA